MKTTIVVSEGDEQSTFTSKRSMCDAYGWDYRKFRNSKGVPKNVGRYRLEKCEVGLTIPCRRLRSFLDKKLLLRVIQNDGISEFVLTFKKLKYTVFVVESSAKITRVVDWSTNESVVMDAKTESMLIKLLPPWIK